MLILGLNYLSHDAAVTLIKDGKIIAACEEERFNKEKHTKKVPVGAIDACLRYAGISIKNIDKIAIFVKPYKSLALPLYNLFQAFPSSILYIPYGFKVFVKRLRMRRALESSLHLAHFQSPLPSIVYISHHSAHAGSAFYLSPFWQSAVLTIDGRGEYETTAIFLGRGTHLQKLYSIKYPHSVGYLYSMVTKYLGFVPQYDESKVMGLAAYGTPRFYDDFKKIVFLQPDGSFRLNLQYFDHHYRYGHNRRFFTQKFTRQFGPPRLRTEPLLQRHADIAYALQKTTEEIILGLARKAYLLTKSKNLCVAGGVALNCAANATLISSNIFQRVFIQPAANDAGGSLGAALCSYYRSCPNSPRHSLQDVFLGPSPNIESEISKLIPAFSNFLEIERVGDIYKATAQLIHRGNIIGWFQGKMEFGPRALGHRSIIAAPVDVNIREIINNKIKLRERFRPLAPAVLSEYANQFFDCNPKGQYIYPFMLATVKAKTEALGKIPAVIHEDGTARIQVVNRKSNPSFWFLLKAYFRLSGIPVLLNTSLNLHGEPIVSSVQDALEMFYRSKLNYMVIGHYILRRKKSL